MLFLMTACQNTDTDLSEITVAAATSLTDVTIELKQLFEKQNSNLKLCFTYGSSGTLQTQIEQGAPIDIFISASQKQMDSLKKKELLIEDSVYNIVENEIVLILPKESDKKIDKFEKLTDENINSIAVGDISSVPIGQYSYDIFDKMGIWNRVSPKLVYGTDVRQVLTWVETSQVDCGIVYTTDAFVSDRVKIAAYADKEFTTPVIYPVSIIKDSKKIEYAKEFIQFLKTNSALKIFEKYGFKRVGEYGTVSSMAIN